MMGLHLYRWPMPPLAGRSGGGGGGEEEERRERRESILGIGVRERDFSYD
jgi:hypothetical protein